MAAFGPKAESGKPLQDSFMNSRPDSAPGRAAPSRRDPGDLEPTFSPTGRFAAPQRRQ